MYVWNDTTTIYVEVDITGGWCMTESHVIAANVLGDIPQKNGNPIPGKFPDGGTYSPCVTTDTFTFAIDDVGTNPFIAVHATVWDTNAASLTTDTIYSTVGDPVYGPVLSYLTPAAAGWGAPLAAVEPSYAPGSWPQITGATWISTEAQEAVSPVPDSWRLAKGNLPVPSGALPLTGSVDMVTADNAERVWHNGSVIGTDGEVNVPFTDNHEWSTIETYPFTPVVGDNTLSFVWRNYGYCATDTDYCTAPGLNLGPASNPNGLVYKASVTYATHSESAWAGTAPGVTAFPGKNWATYFRYDVNLETATLYDVSSSPATTWTCAAGVTDLSTPTDGTVTWARAGDTIYVQVNVWDGLPSATYDVWVEQNPGTCPPGTSTPSNDGALVTDASGNGTATFSFTATAGAQNFWLSLWTPSGPPYPGSGAQVLRVPAVQL